jgi:Fe-S oxidoreductase
VTATRQTFAGLAHWQIVFWYCLGALSTCIFVLGVALLVRKYRAGRTSTDSAPRGSAGAALWAVLAQTTIRRQDRLAGFAHALTFYGFVVLFIGTLILAVEDDLARPLGWDFWRGDFYLGYSFFLDLFGSALTVGVLIFAAKRVRRPLRLDYSRVDGRVASYDRRRYVIGDWALLGTLLFLAVSGFLLEALRIADKNPAFERWSPCGWGLGQGLRAVGLTGELAADAHFSLWWVHGIAALAFVSAIPFTKAMHLLVDPVSLVEREPLPGVRLPRPVDIRGASPGYSVVTDLSPKHLLNLDACTKCGNCHVVCPATATGLPLSPRDVILDLREHAEGALGARHAFRVPPVESAATNLAEVVPSETLWSCMQCMACVDVCPVGVEHVPIIVDLRRSRVDEGDLDETLQATLEAIYEVGNSFGLPRRRRPRWVEALDFAPKDARVEPVDVLWFLGDYASLEPRNQHATQALASVLHYAGVDFGILYEDERNAGNDVRRVGEEALFVELAERNIETLTACEFRRILTSDPHTYNTLKNEYPDLGGSWSVVHHSELLLELVQERRLQPMKPLGVRVTYHDPCALGRSNGVYEPPRLVLEAIGCDLVEMPRNRANSFCCGAGGGRIWMADAGGRGVARPAEARIQEAVALGDVDLFVVACPKDVVMYADAIKTSGHEGRIRLAELSELVHEALGPMPAPPCLIPLS